jgi:uncharacterized protein
MNSYWSLGLINFMKLRQSIIACLIVLILCLGIFAQSEPKISVNESPLPDPTGMVNDYANVIDDGVQAQIEQKLRDFKAKTNPNIEIAVVTVRTTGERPIFDYSLAVARGWKIGDKGATNSSALLLVAVDDKKYFTQVSGGLQDELTDGIVGQLQRQYLVPPFKAGNYTKGISDTVDAYLRTIEERNSSPDGSTTPTPVPASTQKSPFSGGSRLCCCLIIILVVLIIIFFGRGGSGGGGGSGRSRWGGRGGNSSFFPPLIVWGGGGSSSSSGWGGSSGGGGDSWGGFSGGGGGFDGGGAGGDW